MDTESSNTSQEYQDIIAEKLWTVQYIIRNCDKAQPHKSKSLNNLLFHFTGTTNNKKYVEQILNEFRAKMTFKEWLDSTKEDQSDLTVSYKDMRKTITNQYVNKLKLPTRESIFLEITSLGYFLFTKQISDHDLLKNGFKWRRLPNLPSKSNEDAKVIVVEDTQQFFRRLKYFHKMKEFRDSGRNIIHLELVDVSKCHKDGSPKNVIAVLAASPNHEVINIDKKVNDLNEWLKITLHTVPENSVFVIEPSGLEFKEICELPTIHSQRNKMMKWLDYYNIPYEEKAHKAELFALIQKYKARCPPRYKYCEYIKSFGHDVIIRPPELAFTKYFGFLLKDLPTVNCNENFCHFLQEVSDDCLKQDRVMAEAEMEIYDEDQKLDLLVDKVIECFKYGRISEAEMETMDCETGFANDDYYNSILCK